MSEKHVVIATFTLPMEAHLACGRLHAEGIPAHVTGDEVSAAFAGFGAITRVELYVPESACERALNILAECMPEEQWRLMFGKDLQHVETNPAEWTSDERVKPGAEFEGERDSRLWVCTLCGDAVNIKESVCPSCGTAREALRSTTTERQREEQPVRRASTADIQQGRTVPSGRSLNSGFEVPEVNEYSPGDVLAGRALTAAVAAALSIPLAFFLGFCVGGLVNGFFFLIALYFLLQLMFFSDKLSPRATRKYYLALVLDMLLLGYKVVFFCLNNMR
jgi:hypothetical protein